MTITSSTSADFEARVDRARAVKIEDELRRHRGIRNLKKGKDGNLSGPCPRCGGTDRFSIHIKKQLFNCRKCIKGGGGAINLVQFLDGVDFVRAVETLTGAQRPVVQQETVEDTKESAEQDEAKQHRKATWFWSQRRPIMGTIAETYLREARKITCPLPPTLAFLPSRKPEHHPAMISAYTIPNESEPGVLDITGAKITAVHFTLLKADGSGKADVEKPKFTLGRPLGLPIVIAPVTDTLALVITEGIEDALSVYQATGLGTWAAGSAVFMPSLKVPDYVEAVTIIADDDKSGQQGAGGLAQQLHQRGGIEIFLEGVAP
jgi:putative DNA primase/helicase